MGMTSHPQPVMEMTCHPKVGDRVGWATEYTFIFFIGSFFGWFPVNEWLGLRQLEMQGISMGDTLGLFYLCLP
jgi:hypothetical protein